MPIMVEREKWILYKHTSDYELIKAVALDVKNQCASDISDSARIMLRNRLAALNLYRSRNPKSRPLDSINHRINTLEFFMFGYEEKRSKRFMFSPLGNLFLKHIDNEEKTRKIFTTMLFALQFQHWANGTPSSFQLYPFRLLFKLMLDERLGGKLYSTEYAYIVAFLTKVDETSYEKLVADILSFRKLPDSTKSLLLKEDEHTYVNTIYEWQYYTQKLLKTIGIINVVDGDNIARLYHPQKPNSHSNPTGRWVKNGYATISKNVALFVQGLLELYPAEDVPIRFDDDERMQIDIVKEIYSFYPEFLLKEIGESYNNVQTKLLQLPGLIEKYSNNENNETAYLFEDVLTEGFNMFVNVEARKIGGAGHTDVECLYITQRKKFAVDAKSTANKLMGLNAGRLRIHRKEIGAKYTIVVTPRYTPAVLQDIEDTPIVLILASTFSEYLYNHIFHDVRNIDYKDFDEIIVNNLGKDISGLISNMTMEKFATIEVS